ncbi:hypothetical protein CAEBREN_00175 [Caenorhabditis brenneri]|uniref:Uncharacterized protein n=1 Tax=Caenorhabditis brenneri TaxID=135651 RepID=G0MT34_CAEBE|nr:hypothetical protein CAEBREN_00175 [Caenorhabditis brenneri]
MLLFAFLFFSFFTFSNGQQIIRVDQLKGGGLVNEIDVEPPYSVYFSGSKDADEDLKSIFLNTEDGEKKNFFDLKHSKFDEFSDLLTSFQVNSTATVTTGLGKLTLNWMKGFIYIVPEKQTKDKCFRVYDVDKIQIVKTSEETDCTLVFLNTNHEASPVQSSKFTEWEQSESSSAKLYKGFPKDDEEGIPVFSNPIEVIGKSIVFIPDRFSVRFEVFHIKTSNHLHFKVSSGHVEMNGHTTSGYTTTGLVMKKTDEKPQDINIICVQDTRYNGTVGVNIVGQPKGTVTVKAVDYVDFEGITVRPKSEKYTWTADLAQELNISSQNADDGEFYIQYFIVQGQKVSDKFKAIPEPLVGKTGQPGMNLFVLGIILFVIL